ncbi:hypothetical protein D9M68_386410 [compost metagenome]
MVELLEQLRADEAVAGRHDQLHRHLGRPFAGAEQALDEVGAVELDPVPAIGGLGGIGLCLAHPFQSAQQGRPGAGES